MGKPAGFLNKQLWAGLAAVCVLLQGGQVNAASLSLEEAIQLSLANHSTVKIAEWGEVKAAGVLQEAEAARLPVYTISHNTATTHYYAYEYKTAGVNASYPAYIDNSYQNQVSMRLPLYSGGKLENAVDQAKMAVTAAGCDTAAARQQLALDTSIAYYNVLQNKVLWEVAQQETDTFAKHLDEAKIRYEAGEVGIADELQSQVELANARQNLIKAENNYKLALVYLCKIVGLPQDSSLELKENFSYMPLTYSLEEAFATAEKNRAEIHKADLSTDIARKEIDIAQSNDRPQATFSSNYYWKNDNFPGTKKYYWDMNVYVSMNVFDQGTTRAKLKQAQAQVAQALEQARQQRDDIQYEVRQAYYDVKAAEARIVEAKLAVKQAEESRNISEVRYQYGVETNMDVIDTQLRLTQARTNYIQALYDYHTSKARLDRAIGAGKQ